MIKMIRKLHSISKLFLKITKVKLSSVKMINFYNILCNFVKLAAFSNQSFNP